jgi:transcriptional regulator with XRE-family HTH domain
MLGDGLRKARQAKGLTQKELAVLSGLSNSVICDFEKGRRNPSIAALLRLADALGVQPAALLGDGIQKASA